MRWQALLAVLVIFGAGIATGSVLTRVFTPAATKVETPLPGPSVPFGSVRGRDYVERLDREVNLTEEQRARIEEIIAGSQARLREVWEPVAPVAREEFRRTRAEISELLTPEQREKLEQSRKERRGRVHWEERGRDGGKRGSEAAVEEK